MVSCQTLGWQKGFGGHRIVNGPTILAVLPPPLGGGKHFFSKLKNRREFEGGLHEIRKGKGGKRRRKKKMIKHTLKYIYEAYDCKKIHKNSKNFNRGEGSIFLAGQKIYPCKQEKK